MLFTSIDELRQHLAVSVGSDFVTLQPYIDKAELLFVKPILGADLYEHLCSYMDGDRDDEATEALLKKVQRVLAYYTYYLYIPIGQLNITESGIHITTTDTKKTAFEWQIKELRRSMLESAHTFADDLITYLEALDTGGSGSGSASGSETTSTLYDLWAQSSGYTNTHDLIFVTAEDFNEYFFINKSRRLFVQLRAIIKAVTEKSIKANISAAYCAELITKRNGGTLTADDDTILAKIKYALAHLTMARCIVEISPDLWPEGLFGYYIGTADSGTITYPEKLAQLRATLQQDGESELKDVQVYLDANASATKYATYFESDTYQAPDATAPRGEITNTTSSKIITM